MRKGRQRCRFHRDGGIRAKPEGGEGACVHLQEELSAEGTASAKALRLGRVGFGAVGGWSDGSRGNERAR